MTLGGSEHIPIRTMRWWDIEAVMALELALFDDPWSAELFWSELAQGETRHYVLAETDGELAGYAGAALHAGEGAVQTLAVAPAYQRRGLGRRLLSHLLRTAHERGVPVMTLEVRADNEAAQSLYREFGFEPVGLRRRYYEVSGKDAVVMLAEGVDTPGYAVRLGGAV